MGNRTVEDCLEFEHEYGGEARVAFLSCAHCAHQNLHQETIEVFERIQDDERGLRVVVKHAADTPRTADGRPVGDVTSKLIADSILHGNPSPRRQGLRVKCRCEDCGKLTSLVIFQHKGTTYVDVE